MLSLEELYLEGGEELVRYRGAPLLRKSLDCLLERVNLSFRAKTPIIIPH